MQFSQRLLSKGKPIWEAYLEHPLYRECILTYADIEYNKENDWCIKLMDKLAEGLPEKQLQKLEELFILSSKYEYMFWDGCYKKESWFI